MKIKIALLFLVLGISPVYAGQTALSATNYVSTQSIQANLTPLQALQRLEAGNARFLSGNTLNRDWLAQVKQTQSGQYPFAVVLNCMDSRALPELSFDQGIGDLFVIRVAGNVVDKDVLGSMEYATKVVGTKLIVVMGHTGCGAVGGACKSVDLGNLTGLLAKIKPAVKQAETQLGTVDCSNPTLIDQIARDNVLNQMQQIVQQSPIIKELLKEHKIGIVGAMYDIGTGRVTFIEDEGLLPN